MKKLSAILVILALAFSTPLYAMGKKPPKNSLQGCIYEADQKAEKSGLKSPWVGGNEQEWANFTQPLYDVCIAKYRKK